MHVSTAEFDAWGAVKESTFLWTSFEWTSYFYTDIGRLSSDFSNYFAFLPKNMNTLINYKDDHVPITCIPSAVYFTNTFALEKI